MALWTKAVQRHAHMNEIFFNAAALLVVIEHVPQDIIDRLTELREMDLGCQSKFGYTCT